MAAGRYFLQIRSHDNLYILCKFYAPMRGQSSMEYVTTYGWVILIILIAVGALSYFGVFRPTQVVQDQCTFGEQLICTDYLISGSPGNYQLSLRLQNSFGKTIEIQDIQMSSPDSVSSCGLPITVAPADEADITCYLGTSKSDFGIFNLAVDLKNDDNPGAPVHTVRGFLSTEI